jgi:dihydroorotate dehydrogenase
MGSGVISTGFDAVEFILLGSTIVQVCTEVMLKDYNIVGKMKSNLEEFISRHNFNS